MYPYDFDSIGTVNTVWPGKYRMFWVFVIVLLFIYLFIFIFPRTTTIYNNQKQVNHLGIMSVFVLSMENCLKSLWLDFRHCQTWKWTPYRTTCLLRPRYRESCLKQNMIMINVVFVRNIREVKQSLLSDARRQVRKYEA